MSSVTPTATDPSTALNKNQQTTKETMKPTSTGTKTKEADAASTEQIDREKLLSELLDLVDLGSFSRESFVKVALTMNQAAPPSSGDSTNDLTKRLIQDHDEARADKMFPWKEIDRTYSEMYESMVHQTSEETTRESLREIFEERLRAAGSSPVHPDVVFIVTALLYLPDNVHRDTYLAHLLLNFGPEERLQIHNWFVKREADNIMHDTLAKAIYKKALKHPLLPGKNFGYMNRTMAEQAVAAETTLEGAGPNRRRATEKMATSLYGRKAEAEPLVGGGPQTSVPIYADGNPQPVGHADTTQISDGMSELHAMIVQLSHQNEILRKQSTAQQRKIRALEEQAQNGYITATTANRSLASRGRGGNRSGRAGGRGAYGRGRGNGYGSGYYRGGEAEDEHEDHVFENTKNE